MIIGGDIAHYDRLSRTRADNCGNVANIRCTKFCIKLFHYSQKEKKNFSETKICTRVTYLNKCDTFLIHDGRLSYTAPIYHFPGRNVYISPPRRFCLLAYARCAFSWLLLGKSVATLSSLSFLCIYIYSRCASEEPRAALLSCRYATSVFLRYECSARKLQVLRILMCRVALWICVSRDFGGVDWFYFCYYWLE